MAPTSVTRTTTTGTERIRARLLTALHVGKLRPGDRVPSVRRLAELTGLNRKTVHRAYTTLAREGLLDVRPGSGTYVTDERGATPKEPSTRDLVAAVNRCRAEAGALGMAPAVYARFVAACFGDGLRGVPVTVVECNFEQIGTIARDIARATGIVPKPMRVRDVIANPEAARRGGAVVTTNCHMGEVSERLEPLGVPVYAVSLDADFPARIARFGTRGDLVMVVRDRAFDGVFRRLLEQLKTSREHIERIRIVDPAGATGAFRDLPRGGYVYVSPLVEDEMRGRTPPRFERVAGRWRVPTPALERLRASLALDVALRSG